MRRKFKITLLALIIILLLVPVIFLHLAPVSFDANPSAGGYRRWVADKHTEEIVKEFILKSGYDSNSYKVLSKPEETASTVYWRDRNIYLTVIIELNEEKTTLLVEGKRYWIEKYNWEIEKL